MRSSIALQCVAVLKLLWFVSGSGSGSTRQAKGARTGPPLARSWMYWQDVLRESPTTKVRHSTC